MSNHWRDDSFERLEYGSAQKKPQQTKPQTQTNKMSQVMKRMAESGGFDEAAQVEKKSASAGNFTPLDADELKRGFAEQDHPELENIRKKLHYLRLQQSQTLKAIEERKREEEARKQKMEEEENLKKTAIAQDTLTPVEAPKGKVRKSIFGGKKKVQQTQAEFKPGSSKF